jgi:hypothetical protein
MMGDGNAETVVGLKLGALERIKKIAVKVHHHKRKKLNH